MPGPSADPRPDLALAKAKVLSAWTKDPKDLYALGTAARPLTEDALVRALGYSDVRALLTGELPEIDAEALQRAVLFERLIDDGKLVRPRGAPGDLMVDVPNDRGGAEPQFFSDSSLEELQRALDRLLGVKPQPVPDPKQPQPAPTQPQPGPQPPVSTQPAPDPASSPQPAPVPQPPVSTPPPPSPPVQLPTRLGSVPVWVILVAVAGASWAVCSLSRSTPVAPRSAPPPLPSEVARPTPAPPALPTHPAAVPHRTAPAKPALAAPSPLPAPAPPSVRPPVEDEKNDMPLEEFKRIQREQGPTTHPVE
jgi:hypothetical protein